MDELSEDDKLTVAARARSSSSCRSRSTSPSSSPGMQAATSRSRTRSAASSEIVDGKHDDVPEQAFSTSGTIEEALEKAEKMKQRGGLRRMTPDTAQPRDRHARAAGRSRETVDEVVLPGAEGLPRRAAGPRAAPDAARRRRDLVPRRRRAHATSPSSGGFAEVLRDRRRACWPRRPSRPDEIDVDAGPAKPRSAPRRRRDGAPTSSDSGRIRQAEASRGSRTSAVPQSDDRGPGLTRPASPVGRRAGLQRSRAPGARSAGDRLATSTSSGSTPRSWSSTTARG